VRQQHHRQVRMGLGKCGEEGLRTRVTVRRQTDQDRLVVGIGTAEGKRGIRVSADNLRPESGGLQDTRERVSQGGCWLNNKYWRHGVLRSLAQVVVISALMWSTICATPLIRQMYPN